MNAPSSERRLYRSRDGMVLGVCKGVANYLNVSVTGIRAAVILVTIATALWPMVGVYIIVGLMLKPEPVIPFGDQTEQAFYESYNDSRSGAVQRLKQKFDTLDRRIRRIEDRVTSRDFDWKQRFGNGS